MPSIHFDQSEHHIRDVFMWFLLLNKKKSHHRGFCPFGWGLSFSKMLPLGSSLPFKAELTFPPSQGRSHSFPITAGLGLPLKAFPGITIKYLSNYVYRLCQDTLSNPQSFFKTPTAISSQKFPHLRGVALYLLTHGHTCSPSHCADAFLSLCIFLPQFLRRVSWVRLKKRLRHWWWELDGKYPKQGHPTAYGTRSLYSLWDKVTTQSVGQGHSTVHRTRSPTVCGTRSLHSLWDEVTP